MKHEQLKLEEIEVSHTLGGYGRCRSYSVVREMSHALQSVGLAESAATRTKVWLRKKTMDLCACESEEHDHEVGAGVNAIIMSDTRY